MINFLVLFEEFVSKCNLEKSQDNNSISIDYLKISVIILKLIKKKNLFN